MKKKLMSIMLAASMVCLLLTGCNGSESASAANSGNAEQTEETTENKDVDVAEQAEGTEDSTTTEVKNDADVQVTEAQKSSATEAEGASAKKIVYLVKTEESYTIVDGEKAYGSKTEYEYDEQGNQVYEKTTSSDSTYVEYIHEYDKNGNLTYSKQIRHSDKGIEESICYYKYDLDEEGRVIKAYILDKDKNPTTSYREYSYAGDQYEVVYYNGNTITSSDEVFTSNGEIYELVTKQYNEEYPKTEDGESYFAKLVETYEGTRITKFEVYSVTGEKKRETRYEYELDENNNPIVKKSCFISPIDGRVSNIGITEYTYIEIEK